MDAAYRSGTGEGNAPFVLRPPLRRIGESGMVRANERKAADMVVEVEDVRLSFGEKKVLEGVTFAVRRGETVALLGESGGGKSVCLKVILGLQAPDAGRVKLFGEEVTGLSDERLEPIRRRIGIVYQSAALFSAFSVAENVALELREVMKLPEDEIEKRVRRSLEAVGLGDVDPDLRPDELSGGMKKRLAVARAIAPEPEAVFYDEPTSGLDPINSARILSLIGELDESYGVTSLVVTHDVRGAMDICDRMVLLAKGRIAFDGPPRAFMASKEEAVREYLSAAPDLAACGVGAGTRPGARAGAARRGRSGNPRKRQAGTGRTLREGGSSPPARGRGGHPPFP
jgi:phospholipid/cholesterol/gamma-HCH transport system ATP-binding protein